MVGNKSILISFVIVIQSKLVESWKMKVCLNGTVYLAEEHKCRGGVWFVEPISLSSLCFEKGIWAIYDDWCQTNPLIWTVYPHSKGCLSDRNLRKKILGIVYLGNEKSGGLVATSGRRLFLKNKHLQGKLLELVDGNLLEVFTWGKNVNFALEIRKFLETVQSCLIKPKTTFFAIYNFEFQNRHNISLTLGDNLCLDAGYEGTRKQKSPNERYFEIYGSHKNSMESTCKPDIIEGPQYQEEYFEREDADVLDIIQRKVDDQSQRIGKKFYAHKFYEDDVSPEMEFEEWKFLEMALQIFKKACPPDMVSETYLNNVFLLFKFAIYESFNIFPPNVDRDEDTRQRIWSALTSCDSRATKIPFTNVDTCSNKVPLMKFKTKNGTTTLRRLKMPKHIKINVEKFDLILESVWKIMIFIHYFCAESFNEFSSDLSVLQNRWQSLLAPDLIRRWKYPGRSLEMIQRLFMNMDFERNIKNLDYCVGAAHIYSPYKGWLKRPLTKFKFRLRNASRDDLMWDGQAFCANDATYPAVKLGYVVEECGIRLSK